MTGQSKSSLPLILEEEEMSVEEDDGEQEEDSTYTDSLSTLVASKPDEVVCWSIYI